MASEKELRTPLPPKVFVLNTTTSKMDWNSPANISSGNKGLGWLTNVKNNINTVDDDDNVQVISFKSGGENGNNSTECNENDSDSDVISNYIGHYGRWQFFWTFLLALFQFPTTFEIFALVFQVKIKYDSRYGCT